MKTRPEPPEMLENEHLIFLDELRESDKTNMYGARPFLMDEFSIDKNDALEILTYWMNTYRDRHAKPK